MAFGFAGAAAGGSKALEDIVAQRLFVHKLEAEIANRQKLTEIEGAQLNQRAVEHSDNMKARQRDDDRMDAGRRDQNNARGLDLMDKDRARMDVDSAVEGLPEHMKGMGPLIKVGAMGKLSPEDMRDPAAVAAEAAAKKEAEYNDWKTKQDYNENQIRSRPKESPAPKPTGPGGLSTAQGNTALKFQDDYARDSKPYITMRDAFQRVQSAAAKPDAAGDLSMIFAYMKMLDPNSVVREQEFANAQNAAGVPDRIRNVYNKVMQGNRLGPDQRQQFVSQANSLFENARGNQAKVRQTYGSRAKQWEIPESMVLDEDDAPTQQQAAPTDKPALVWDGTKFVKPGGD
jgi:hypothetical protein